MGPSAHTRYGKVHDYVYYPKSWTDTESGKEYKSGYYDENGTHYDYVAFKRNEKYETRLSCDYCGTEIKTEWSEGTVPVCPNCGANLQEVLMHTAVDEEQTEPSSSVNFGKAFGKTILKVGIITSLMFFTATLPALFFGLNKAGKDKAETDHPSSIYVPEIGRACKWSDSDESFYDPETDCYFWYNTDIEPPQWQYWYEGVSSDYGDYGWMEYDIGESQWYIEESDANWIKLPDSYDRSEMWYTTMTPDQG